MFSLSFRVLGMMQQDAQKDPEVFPYAVHARALVNQVYPHSFVVP